MSEAAIVVATRRSEWRLSCCEWHELLCAWRWEGPIRGRGHEPVTEDSDLGVTAAAVARLLLMAHGGKSAITLFIWLIAVLFIDLLWEKNTIEWQGDLTDKFKRTVLFYGGCGVRGSRRHMAIYYGRLDGADFFKTSFKRYTFTCSLHLKKN